MLAMSGKLVSVGVEGQLFFWVYDYDWTKPSKQHLVKLPKGNTYFSIFSLEQDEEYNKLCRSKYYKILFKAPKAVNYNPNHGDLPRNRLVIYEVRGDEQSSSV